MWLIILIVLWWILLTLSIRLWWILLTVSIRLWWILLTLSILLLWILLTLSILFLWILLWWILFYNRSCSGYSNITSSSIPVLSPSTMTSIGMRQEGRIVSELSRIIINGTSVFKIHLRSMTFKCVLQKCYFILTPKAAMCALENHHELY